MSKYIAAVIQAASFPDDSIKSAQRAAQLIQEAAAHGARLAVFPEAFIGGYPKGSSFGSPVGMRAPEGREAYRSYYEASIDLAGDEVEIIAAATAETGMFAVIGCIERDHGTLYCTALFFDGDKGLVGKHRKLMPTAAERLVWGFGDGSTMPVYDTSLGRIGAVICWENYMPAMRLHMFSKGISIYCAPTADDRDTWIPSMQHVALEGRCFVLTACQHITRERYSEHYDSALGDAPDTVMMRGGSAIIDPLGRILVGPDFNGETILYAEIDLHQIARGKYDLDATGHYARPDIFHLTVDERAKPAVSILDDSSRTA